MPRKDRTAMLLSMGLHGLMAALLVNALPPRSQRLLLRNQAGTRITFEPRSQRMRLEKQPSQPVASTPPRPFTPLPMAALLPTLPAIALLRRPTGASASMLPASPRSPSLSPPSEAPTTGSQMGTGKPPGSSSGSVPGAGIDLFPQRALCKSIGCDQGPAQGSEGRLQAAVNDELALQQGAVAVKLGSVDSIWLDLGRDMEKRFAPKMSAVNSPTRPMMAARQLVRPLPLVPEKTQAGWLVRQDKRLRIEDEIRAIQDAYDEPAARRETEVDVEIDAEGNMVSVRVVMPSGSREFDREAVRAVTQAVRQRPLNPQGERGPVIARYALRADIAVNLPRVAPGMNTDGGSVHGGILTMGGSFDEVTGKADVRVPFMKRLKTSVHLLSIRPRPAPSP